MIASDGQHPGILEQFTAAIDATPTIRDVAGADDGIDVLSRQPVENLLESVVFAVQIADDTESLNHDADRN